MIYKTTLLLIGILIFIYIVYPVSLYLISKLKPKNVNKKYITPSITFFIPTHIEEETIKGKLENTFSLDYPKDKMEVLIVDSNSKDSTVKKIKQFEKETGFKVRLIIEKERKCKISAINLGIKNAKHEIIVMSDSPARFEKDTLKEIIANFNDPSIGATTGRFAFSITNQITREAEVFWKYKSILRDLESRVDSTTYLSGELCAFRKSLIEELPIDQINDDTIIAVKVREKGYRTISDPRAIFYEKTPDNRKDEYTQKTRKAIGALLMTMANLHLIKPKYGLFGLYIFPMRLLFVPVSSFLVIISTIFIAKILLASIFVSYFVIFLGIFLLIPKGRAVLFSFYWNHIVVIISVIKFVFGKYDVKWKQVKSTRK